MKATYINSSMQPSLQRKSVMNCFKVIWRLTNRKRSSETANNSPPPHLTINTSVYLPLFTSRNIVLTGMHILPQRFVFLSKPWHAQSWFCQVRLRFCLVDSHPIHHQLFSTYLKFNLCGFFIALSLLGTFQVYHINTLLSDPLSIFPQDHYFHSYPLISWKMKLQKHTCCAHYLPSTHMIYLTEYYVIMRH